MLCQKVKYRKSQGRNTASKESRGTELSFGSYGLKSLEEKWITSNWKQPIGQLVVTFRRRKSWIEFF